MDEPPSYDAVVKASQVLADIAPLLRPAVHTRRRQHLSACLQAPFTRNDRSAEVECDTKVTVTDPVLQRGSGGGQVWPVVFPYRQIYRTSRMAPDQTALNHHASRNELQEC
jgi:hypothetical protein